MKERNYGFDVARIVMSICVIAMHTMNHYSFQTFHGAMMLPVLFISADGVFYMLSGYFNLNKEFNSVSDIKKYYKSKFLTVLLPFLAFNLFWTAWDYIHANNSFDLLKILDIFYRAVMDTSAGGHMWFMYPLFGLLLATPFLSIMLHNMTDRQVKMLFRIAIGYAFVCYYLCWNLGVGFSVLAWFLEGWGTVYLAGYYYRRIASKESSLKWAILSVLGFVVTILGMRNKLPFLKGFAGATDVQPMFTLFEMGCMLFWDKVVRFTNKKVGKVITFLSKNTFLIYLYHMRGIEYATRKFNIVDGAKGNFFKVVFGTFAVSLIASIATNLCLKLVQKPLDKVWKIKETID